MIAINALICIRSQAVGVIGSRDHPGSHSYSLRVSVGGTQVRHTTAFRSSRCLDTFAALLGDAKAEQSLMEGLRGLDPPGYVRWAVRPVISSGLSSSWCINYTPT